MAAVTDPETRGFRLSQLIYDTRYRSMTIQIVALIAVLMLFGWLANNTVENLARQGKTFNFSFLGAPAGYDINQSLIEYNNQDTHARAALVGLLNTLLVAFLGCVTATVIGVFVGVLRLSNNWLVARLMTVYVETFRNVPVLLWIILANAIMITNLPQPSAFRGANPEAQMVLGSAFTNRGVYVPEPLFSRSLGDISFFGIFDISLDLIALLVVLAAGIWVARRIAVRADRIQEATGNRPMTWAPRLVSVAGPVVVLLFALGFHLGFPELKGFNFQGGTQGLQLPGRHLSAHLADLALAGAVALYGRVHRRNRARRRQGDLEGTDRGRGRAWPAPRPDHEPGGAAAGAPHHHPAADQPVPEPDQEQLARRGRRLHGHHRHADGRDPEPDRARTGMRAADHADLPDHLPGHLGGDEPLQRAREAEGALRWPRNPSSAPR